MMKIMPTILLTAGILQVFATAAFADGDVAKGAIAFKKCVACHEGAKPTNKLGPHLVALFGRKVAGVEGYKYSEAMKAYAATVPAWDEVNFNTYIEKPKALVVGTKMAFGGIAKPEERENLIAYLKTLK
jgi:cytochrome c